MRIKLPCILLALLTASTAYSQAPDDIDAPEAQQDSNPYEEMTSVIKKSPTATVIENNVHEIPECSDEDDSGCPPEVPEVTHFHIRTGTEVACASAGTASFLRNNKLDYAEVTQTTVNVVRRGTVGPATETVVREDTEDSSALGGEGFRDDNLKFSLVAWTTVESVDQRKSPPPFSYTDLSDEVKDFFTSGERETFLKNINVEDMQRRFIRHFKTRQGGYVNVKNPPTDLPPSHPEKITVLPPLSGRVHAIAYDDNVPSSAGEAFLKPADVQAGSLEGWEECERKRDRLKENVNPNEIAKCNKILLNSYFKQVYNNEEHQAWSSGGGADQKPKLVYSTHFAVQSCKEYSHSPRDEGAITASKVIENLNGLVESLKTPGNASNGDEPTESVFYKLKKKFEELKKQYEKLKKAKKNLAKTTCTPITPTNCLNLGEKATEKQEQSSAIKEINNLLKYAPVKDLKAYTNKQSSCYHLRSGIREELNLSDTVAYSPKWWEHTDLGFACKLLHEQINSDDKLILTFDEVNESTSGEKADEMIKRAEKVEGFVSKVLKLEQIEQEYQKTPRKTNFVCSPNTDKLEVKAAQQNKQGPTPDWHRLLSSAVLDMRQDYGVLRKKPNRIFSSTHPSGDFGFNKNEQYLVTRDPHFMTFYTSLKGRERGDRQFPTGLGLPMVIVPGEGYKLPSVIGTEEAQGYGISVYAYPISICEIVTITRFPARHR